MAVKFSLKDWQKLLVPEFTISAISLEDRMVRVFCFDRDINRVTKVGKYALPPGIIEEGVLKNRRNCSLFLFPSNKNFGPKKKKFG